MHSLPHNQQSPPEWYIVPVDEPALTLRNHPKCIIYITIHTWCCIFHVFRQMDNEKYPSLYWYGVVSLS